MIDTKFIPDLLSVVGRDALDTLLATECGCWEYAPHTAFDAKRAFRGLEAIGLARWDSDDGEVLTLIGRRVALDLAHVDAALEDMRRSGQLVRFAAPSDWREQLEGADPVRLLETWIEPWEDDAEVGR